MSEPRETYDFIGHEAEEAALADALAGARMHHAWLITGPRRIGKATLAYRFARRALGAKLTGPRPFDVDPGDPIARRIEGRAHPDLFVLERGLNERGKLKRDIAVDDARALGHFFSMAPAEGGMRVAIVDCVDDLNRNAANALLKTLEEPPPRAVLMLVCHAPGGALATVRSRCRRLPLRALSPDEMARVAGEGAASLALLRLARGRPGFVRALAGAGAEALAEDLEAALARLEKDGARAVLTALQSRAGGEGEERLALALDIAGEWLRARALETPNEARWAEAWSALEALRAEADGLDMDPAHALARAAGVLDRAAAARP